MKKQEFLTVIGVACIAVMSLSVLVYAATWTPEQMADWMYRVGKPKIWKMLRNTNEMTAKVDDIQNKMGEGLVGRVIKSSRATSPGGSVILLGYTPPYLSPKKITLWVNLREMDTGDSITIRVHYDSAAEGGFINDVLQPTLTRKWVWDFDGFQSIRGKLIIDELPVAAYLKVDVYQSEGTSFTIYYHAIIEEM